MRNRKNGMFPCGNLEEMLKFFNNDSEGENKTGSSFMKECMSRMNSDDSTFDMKDMMNFYLKIFGEKEQDEKQEHKEEKNHD